jgi:hypothetical protein
VSTEESEKEELNSICFNHSFYFILFYFIEVFSYLTYFLAQGSKEQNEFLASYVEAVALAFQIIDDVTNLRGFQGGSKIKGEDITEGLNTLPSLSPLPLFYFWYLLTVHYYNFSQCRKSNSSNCNGNECRICF